MRGAAVTASVASGGGFGGFGGGPAKIQRESHAPQATCSFLHISAIIF